MSIPPSPIDDTKSPAKTNNNCQVCGDEASSINYGALTCLSCRTFFRRNGFSEKDDLVCRYDADCEMTKSARKHCAPCRLAKCLAVGMSPHLIRKKDLSGKKHKSTKSYSEELVENKTVMVIPQTTALDFSSDGSVSYLNNSEKTMISNVVHAFDTFSPVTEIRRTIETITTSASSLQFDLNQSLQMITLCSNSLQLFISSTPDFKVLTTSEQWSLFQRLSSTVGSEAWNSRDLKSRPH